jgi:hypothetical protein
MQMTHSSLRSVMPLVALRSFWATLPFVRKRQIKATVNDKLRLIYEMLTLGGALPLLWRARVAMNQGNAQIKLGRGGRERLP